MRLLKLLIIIFLLSQASLTGQNISVSASFDSTRILIGDQIHFNIIIDQPAGSRLKLPFFKDTLSKNIVIVSGPVTDTVINTKDQLRITQKYLVTSFDSGHYRINPVFAEVANAQGIKRYYSDYSILEVARAKIAPPDTAMKIFDIVKPYRAPVTFGEILPWLLILLLTAVLVYALFRYIKLFGKNKESEYEPEIHEPAHVIAFRELERLRDENQWQKGETKKYHTRLTEILRQYLENRYGIFSLELTTSETLDALLKTGFKKNESYNKLKSVLTEADLVKFAKYKPEPSENEMSFENAWNFVNETKQTESLISAEPGNDRKKEEGL
jgi:hypothetical protein